MQTVDVNRQEICQETFIWAEGEHGMTPCRDIEWGAYQGQYGYALKFDHGIKFS